MPSAGPNGLSICTHISLGVRVIIVLLVCTDQASLNRNVSAWSLYFKWLASTNWADKNQVVETETQQDCKEAGAMEA